MVPLVLTQQDEILFFALPLYLLLASCTFFVVNLSLHQLRLNGIISTWHYLGRTRLSDI